MKNDGDAGDAMDDITIVDFDGSIKEEIRILRAQLTLLLQEREELLYHICPELVARYARDVGSYENRAHYQEYMILELKRRIEIARAALNREQTVSKETVDEQIKTEYKEFYEKVEQERRRAEQAQKTQAEKERRRKEYERRWQEKYGNDGRDSEDAKGQTVGADAKGAAGNSGDAQAGGRYIGDGSENSSAGGKRTGSAAESNGNANEEAEAEGQERAGADADNDSAGEKKRPSLKDLYRKIIKRLHPDVNPNATEREQELFRRATQAYEEGDIETLQEIYDEVFSAAGSEAEQADNLSPEELLEIKRKLESQIRFLQVEVKEIKSKNPYRYKELLDDPEKLTLVQKALQEAIRLYEVEIQRLNAELDEINREMNELKRKNKR